MNFQVRLINLALGFLYNVNGNSCSVSLRVRKSDMAKNGNAEPKTKSFFTHLVVPIATALVVGGTAPWWVELIKGGEVDNTEENSVSEDISRELITPDSADDNSSIEIQDSEAIVSDNSTIASDSATVSGDNTTIASDQAVVQESYGSGSNISAGRDVQYNEAPESLETVQDSVALALKMGMPYEEGRQILIERGWQPILPATTAQVPDMTGPAIRYIYNEKGYGEVKACSGTGVGFCSFTFHNGRGDTLSISTVDNQPGGIITIASWRFD